MCALKVFVCRLKKQFLIIFVCCICKRPSVIYVSVARAIIFVLNATPALIYYRYYVIFILWLYGGYLVFRLTYITLLNIVQKLNYRIADLCP